LGGVVAELKRWGWSRGADAENSGRGVKKGKEDSAKIREIVNYRWGGEHEV